MDPNASQPNQNLPPNPTQPDPPPNPPQANTQLPPTPPPIRIPASTAPTTTTPPWDKPDPFAGTSINVTSVEGPSVATPHPTSPPLNPPTLPPPEIPTTKSQNKKLIIGFLLGGIILIISLFIGLSLADAYRSLPFTHPITRQIGNILILSLPILPKTPAQVVQASIQAHSTVSSAHFTSSLATSSKSLVSLLGNENFDLVLEGDFDWTDVNNPRTALNLNISNQLSGDLTYLDQSLYFKLNTLPQGVLGMLAGITGAQLSDFDFFLNQWVKIDQTTLDSQARDLLNESESETDQAPFDEAYRQTLTSLYEQDILPNLIMTSSSKDGDPVYHLNLKLTGDSINRVIQTLSQGTPQASSLSYALDSDQVLPSDVIKDIVVDLYINKANYLLNHLAISSTIDNQSFLNQGSTNAVPFALDRETYRIAFALSLKDIGSIQPISAPAESISLDEYAASASSLFARMQSQTIDTNYSTYPTPSVDDPPRDFYPQGF